MSYLITGGAGFIGSHLATRLVANGHQVRVFDNFSSGSPDNLKHLTGSIEIVQGDVMDPAQLHSAMQDMQVVFHEVALPSVPMSVKDPVKTHAVCATGTLNVLEAGRKAGVRRVVYAASSSAYGDQPGLPRRENQVPQILSPYAAAKLTGELYCEAFTATYGLETVRLRYFNVFGPRQDPDSPYAAVIPIWITALSTGRRPIIFGDGMQSRDFVHIENVVEANLLAATAPKASGRVYNIGCGRSVTLVELLKELCRQMGKDYDPDFQPPRTGDIVHSWADISAAQDELGYNPRVDLATGLKPTIEYYLSLVQGGT